MGGLRSNISVNQKLVSVSVLGLALIKLDKRFPREYKSFFLLSQTDTPTPDTQQRRSSGDMKRCLQFNISCSVTTPDVKQFAMFTYKLYI